MEHMSKSMTDTGNSIACLKSTCNKLSDAYKSSHVPFYTKFIGQKNSKDFCEFWGTIQKVMYITCLLVTKNIPNVKTLWSKLWALKKWCIFEVTRCMLTDHT